MKRILSLMLSIMLIFASMTTIGVFAMETYNEVPKDSFWGKVQHSQNNASNVVSLFDGKTTNYWYPKGKQWEGAWVAVDLGKEIELNAIKLDEATTNDGAMVVGCATPTAYDLYYMTSSANYDVLRGVNWADSSLISTTIDPTLSVWTKLGSFSGDEMATFVATNCRYLLVYVTEAASTELAIGEFHAYSPEVVPEIDYALEKNCITDKSGWNIKAWRRYTGANKFVNMIDGDTTNGFDDAVDSGTYFPFVAVDMGRSVPLERIAIKWAYPDKNHMPEKINVYTSDDVAAYNEGRNSSNWSLAAENVPVAASFFDSSFRARNARYFLITVSDFGLTYSGKTRDWIGIGEIYAFANLGHEEEHHLVPKYTFWGKLQSSSNHNSNVVSLFDGTQTNAWLPGKQWAGAWAAVDLGKTMEINGVRLEEAVNSDGMVMSGTSTPANYELYFATDGSDYARLQGVTWSDYSVINTSVDPDLTKWTKLGTYSKNNMATFASRECRYLLVYIKDAANTNLAIGEFNVFSPEAVPAPDYENQRGYIDKSLWGISSTWKIYSNHENLVNLIDGDPTNGYDDAAGDDYLPYVMVDMGNTVKLSRVVMQQTFPHNHYLPESFDIYTSTEAEAYEEGSESEAWTIAAENVKTGSSYFDKVFPIREARYFMIKVNTLGYSYTGRVRDWAVLGELYAFSDSSMLDAYSQLTYGLSVPAGRLAMPVGADGTLGGNGDLVGWASGHTVNNPVYKAGGIDTFLEISNRYWGGAIDYDGWCRYAKEMGAGFVVTTLNCANGFAIAPNPVADAYLGVQPGVICSKVNYVEKLWEACEKYDLKLGLYAVGDWAQRFKPISDGADSETPLSEEHIKRLEDVYGYWSELFGDKVSYWWMDGAHTFTGFHGEPLRRFRNAITKGNPNAIVSFSDTIGDLTNHEMQNDFAANEGYGIELIPDDRWVNGVNFHRYLPLVDYDDGGSAYSITEFVEYMKIVREKGGFIHIGGGDNIKNEGGFDSTQTALYSALKKYVIDGELMPEYIDGSEKIQAGDATSMIRLAKGATKMNEGTSQISRTFAPQLRDTVPFGSRGLKWCFPAKTAPSPNWFVNSESMGKNGNLEYWAGYENVRIPEGVDNIAISVKDYAKEDLKAWPYIINEESHMEIRIDSLDGRAIADNIKNVGHIDFFKFTKGEYYEKPVEGFRIINIPIEPVSGERDIYLVNVLRENKAKNAFEMMTFGDCAVPAKGEAAIYEGGVIGSFDHDDEVCIPDVNFGSKGAISLTIWGATGTVEAGQKIEIYVDAPSFEGGKKIGTYTQPDNGGWGMFKPATASITKQTGTHNIYLKIAGYSGTADIAAIRFNENTAVISENLGFYNTDDVAVFSIGDAGTLKVKATFKLNRSASDYSWSKSYPVIVFAAQYKNGRLWKLDSKETSKVSSYSSSNLDFNISIHPETTECKLFVMTTRGEMVPRMSTVSIKR